MRHRTMREFLIEKNPQKENVPARSHVPKDDAYPDIQPSGISRWKPFTIDTMNHSRGHVLDASITNHGAVSQVQTVPEPTAQSIETVEDLALWCQHTIKPLVDAYLRHTASPTQRPVARRIYPFGVSPDKTTLPTGTQRYHIDFFMGLEGAGAHSIVVGEVKSHLDLRSSNLMGPTVETQHLWRLRRLSHLCKRAVTKYGFFYTDAELIACRFDSDYLGVSIGSAGWDERPLTTQLALWHLCVLAIEEAMGLIA